MPIIANVIDLLGAFDGHSNSENNYPARLFDEDHHTGLAQSQPSKHIRTAGLGWPTERVLSDTLPRCPSDADWTTAMNDDRLYWEFKLDVFRRDLTEATRTFGKNVDLAIRSNDDSVRIAALGNAITSLAIDVATAAESFGAVGEVARMRQEILDIWRATPKIEHGIAGGRVAAVSVAYRDDFRPSWSRGGRMDAAKAFAAFCEFGEAVFEDDLYAEKCVETISKSISRLRLNVRGNKALRLDEETLSFSVVDLQNELFADMPKRRGRPKLKPN